jgi:hypothetical protein
MSIDFQQMGWNSLAPKADPEMHQVPAPLGGSGDRVFECIRFASRRRRATLDPAMLWS